jgi:hypothetical protein
MVGGYKKLLELVGYDKNVETPQDETFTPRVLVIDIEISPILAYVWGLHDQNIPIEMIHTDWFIMSYAAKWLDEKEVIYGDCRKSIGDDKKIVQEIVKLLDEADVVVGQNSDRFDLKKINSRIEIHKLQPPSDFRTVDTLKIAKSKFGFTSNKLGYVSSIVNEKHRKLSHGRYPGNHLWLQCLAGNEKAWKEMELYNKKDVLTTEEYFKKLDKWHNKINYNVFSGSMINKCSCGSTKFIKFGYAFTNKARHQRYRCTECGKTIVDKTNLLSKDKKLSLKTSLH